MNLDELREKLIDSIHSDESATDYFKSRLHEMEMILNLCAICAPYDKYSNDCRMEASSLLSQAPPENLGQVIPLLSVIVSIPPADGENMNGNIACHLIRAIKRGLPHSSGCSYLDIAKLSDDYGCT